MYNFREGSLGLFEGEFGEFRPFLDVLARNFGTDIQSWDSVPLPLGFGELLASFWGRFERF